jgi:hypothetical protein
MPRWVIVPSWHVALGQFEDVIAIRIGWWEFELRLVRRPRLREQVSTSGQLNERVTGREREELPGASGTRRTRALASRASVTTGNDARGLMRSGNALLTRARAPGFSLS